jgi:hypothetical protein
MSSPIDGGSIKLLAAESNQLRFLRVSLTIERR